MFYLPLLTTLASTMELPSSRGTPHYYLFWQRMHPRPSSSQLETKHPSNVDVAIISSSSSNMVVVVGGVSTIPAQSRTQLQIGSLSMVGATPSLSPPPTREEEEVHQIRGFYKHPSALD